MPRSDKRGFSLLLRQAARQAVALLLVTLLPAILTGWLHPRRPSLPGADQGVREITVEDALALARRSPVLWADARSSQAFATQHIPGAIHLTEEAWERLLSGFADVWRPGQPVVVYCDSQRCDTSRSVASRLMREFALKEVYTLQGGWEAWQRRQ
jgi:rhodanese-related sulfurtransferase